MELNSLRPVLDPFFMHVYCPEFVGPPDWADSRTLEKSFLNPSD